MQKPKGSKQRYEAREEWELPWIRLGMGWGLPSVFKNPKELLTVEESLLMTTLHHTFMLSSSGTWAMTNRHVSNKTMHLHLLWTATKGFWRATTGEAAHRTTRLVLMATHLHRNRRLQKEKADAKSQLETKGLPVITSLVCASRLPIHSKSLLSYPFSFLQRKIYSVNHLQNLVVENQTSHVVRPNPQNPLVAPACLVLQTASDPSTFRKLQHLPALLDACRARQN